MASGPEHYRVAERTLDEVVSGVYPEDRQVAWALAKAQVHATLALAAATALQHDAPWWHDASDHGSGWAQVAS